MTYQQMGRKVAFHLEPPISTVDFARRPWTVWNDLQPTTVGKFTRRTLFVRICFQSLMTESLPYDQITARGYRRKR
jgi:hypothetical protein